MTIRHREYSKSQAREASVAALSDLHLGDAAGIARRIPHQTSGGMRQRICIAMALLCKPDLMMLDEPTTALGVTTGVVILDIIDELIEKYAMSMIYISHDIGVINRVSDRIAGMRRTIRDGGTRTGTFHRLRSRIRRRRRGEEATAHQDTDRRER